MKLKQSLIQELTFLKENYHIDNKTHSQFLTFVRRNHALVRNQNIRHHVCCFFLPVHQKSKSIYLVHHKKAMDWIPPGGHMDRGELPVDTIQREFYEELSYTLTSEKVASVDISIKRINKKTQPCKTHYDLWYTVACRQKTPFVYLRDEFFDAGWFPLREALRKMKYTAYRKIVEKIGMGLTDVNLYYHAV